MWPAGRTLCAVDIIIISIHQNTVAKKQTDIEHRTQTSDVVETIRHINTAIHGHCRIGYCACMLSTLVCFTY